MNAPNRLRSPRRHKFIWQEEGGVLGQLLIKDCFVLEIKIFLLLGLCPLSYVTDNLICGLIVT